MNLNIKCLNQEVNENYAIYNGDSCEILKAMPNNSIGYSIYSPPFTDLYCYSNSERDLGNCLNYNDFFNQYQFLIKELYRITKNGRLTSFHCMNLPTQKERDGYLGIKDFRGDLIRAYEKEGWIFASEVCIWKDPLLAAVRTKAIGLMHKQLCKDSSISRQGIPDYLITMRKLGDNEDFISHPDGFKFIDYAGSDEPKEHDYIKSMQDDEDMTFEKGIKRSHLIWQKYASPVWMDIRQTEVLSKNDAREENDEKHICPLQLDVITRAITLWSNENDIVLSPFMGIGSEGYQSILMDRKFIGCELKQSYFEQSKINLKNALKIKNENNKTLFD